jgi:hypothetical protein
VPNFIKDIPQGIDKQIQAIQTLLYDQLKTAWNLSDNKLAMYGRAFRNQTSDGYVPEVYTGKGEYKEVFFDDSFSASVFFGVRENITYNKGTATAEAFIIFMVNLDKIKRPNYRDDESARIDVEKIMSQIRFGFLMQGFTTGIDSVFSEYQGWRKSKGLKYKDQSNSHCFKLNFKLIYNIKS